MSDLLCPFGATLVKRDFGCKYAKEIIRRGGAEIACMQSDAHAKCCALHGVIKTSFLQAMDLEDDLLTVPHNVLVKIQYGGLHGLQALESEDSQLETGIDDISLLVSNVTEKFHALESLPVDAINKVINEYKTQRRRKI